MQAHAVAVVRLVALGLRLAEADRAARAPEVPDRLAALAFYLADAVPAERAEEVALDDDEFQQVLERSTELRFRVQEYPGRRTFIATDAGYRVEVHPQRDWIDELLANRDELRLSELQLKADDPDAKAGALMRLLEAD